MFRDREKEKYMFLKRSGPPVLFSLKARPKGTYKKKRYDFCLADGYSHKNLHSSIRNDAIKCFADRKIPWHDGCNGRSLPSNHLCCSQSCCVNFLFPMVNNERLLLRVFKKVYPEIKAPLQMVIGDVTGGEDYSYLSFEWIGLKDYLGETIRKIGKRTRGANYTSADFAFRFLRADNKIQIVIGEWKYTEYYNRDDKGKNHSRIRNYRDAFNRIPGIFKNNNAELYRGLFYEPFYQLMRLQLLAQEMEVNHEMGADIVTVLHISPMANSEFRRNVTSPYLSKLFPKAEVMDIWRQIVADERFLSVSVEDLLSFIVESKDCADSTWVEYLQARYDFGTIGQ